MYYLNEIFEDISSKYVFINPRTIQTEGLQGYAHYSVKNEKLKSGIYGVSFSKKFDRTVIEIYHDEQINFEEITEEFKLYARYGDLLGFKTSTIKPLLRSGDKVGHFLLNGYGTLGGFGLDSYSSNILMISNNHVFANCNNSRPGDQILDQNQNNIGQLERFVSLVYPPERNLVDIAVGSIFEQHSIGDYSNHRILAAAPAVGMRVHIQGATSGLRYGTIISLQSAINVDYEGGTGVLNFINCLVIRGENGFFSQPGDSGSFIVNETNYVVGILFAGNNDGSLSFGNNINDVIQNIGIKF